MFVYAICVLLRLKQKNCSEFIKKNGERELEFEFVYTLIF